MMTRKRFLTLGGLMCVALLPFIPAQGGDSIKDIKCRIIYVPTPQVVVEKMLDMAKVSKKDVVFDLGCGDGRIVCTSAKKYGAKAVGVDIDPQRIKECMETMKKFDVSKKQVEFRLGNALKVDDLKKASVVMLYMLPEFMQKLENQALKLKPGTRIVAHDYPFPNWKYDEEVVFKGPTREHTLYIWTVKKK